MRHEPARDPQDLERLLIERQHQGDVEGILALYEEEAVVDCSDEPLLRGRRAIGSYFIRVCSTGEKFAHGQQQPAIVSGDLALTSTRLPNGNVTAEIARRQPDGTWLWVVDRFKVG